MLKRPLIKIFEEISTFALGVVGCKRDRPEIKQRFYLFLLFDTLAVTSAREAFSLASIIKLTPN
ncbi:hypothetical protein [Nostoc sp. MS1]|uniref:hypothetical protein n=1 Tax=Nostoc sp. MS1 TaxID=2764711 RepID=UPI001CC5B1AC|nr:hypothetical protein [Nostoc sp. MS1]